MLLRHNLTLKPQTLIVSCQVPVLNFFNLVHPNLQPLMMTRWSPKSKRPTKESGITQHVGKRRCNFWVGQFASGHAPGCWEWAKQPFTTSDLAEARTQSQLVAGNSRCIQHLALRRGAMLPKSGLPSSCSLGSCTIRPLSACRRIRCISSRNQRRSKRPPLLRTVIQT